MYFAGKYINDFASFILLASGKVIFQLLNNAIELIEEIVIWEGHNPGLVYKLKELRIGMDHFGPQILIPLKSD